MLPNVLIIDDLAGSLLTHRQSLCDSYGLNDVTSGSCDYHCPYAIANATFTASQVSHEGRVFNNADVAMAVYQQGPQYYNTSVGYWSLILLDLRFNDDSQADNDLFGIEILKHFMQQKVSTPIIVLSSQPRHSVIEDCRKQGAVDFIERTWQPPQPPPMQVLKNKLFFYAHMEDPQGKLVGVDTSFLALLAQARRASLGAGNVLITGESGTGKELMARYIHEISTRKGKPYLVFNASGVAETLVQDTLFGHVRGAFTGANRDKPGIFELANEGTLFIDEIGELSVNVQNQLLRPLESRQVIRQGGHTPFDYNVKVVLATNKPLRELISHNKFKHDLLNRIEAMNIHLPSLNQRSIDLPLIFVKLAEQICAEHKAVWPRRIDDEIYRYLAQIDWTDGNVRALRNQIERAIKNNPESELFILDDLQPTIGYSDMINNPRRVNVAESLSHVDLPASDGERVSTESLYHCLGGFAQFEKDKLWVFCAIVEHAATQTRVLTVGADKQWRLNLSGTVAFVTGQKITTIKAADFIKKNLNVDESLRLQLFEHFPLVKNLYLLSVKQRVKKRRNTANE